MSTEIEEKRHFVSTERDGDSVAMANANGIHNKGDDVKGVSEDDSDDKVVCKVDGDANGVRSVGDDKDIWTSSGCVDDDVEALGHEDPSVGAVDAGDNLSELEPATSFYAAKKTVAQGMMDIALITSNANQLRYLLEFGSPGPIYYFNMSLIVTSLILQIAVGLALVFKGRADIHGEREEKQAIHLNDYIVVGVFLITIINVFMAAFAIGVTGGSPLLQELQAADASHAQGAPD